MFCDLVGSTALARQLDLEDLRNVIRDFQDRTREVLVRYEGVVARYEGDGVLAYSVTRRRMKTTRSARFMPVWASSRRSAPNNVKTALLKRRLRVRIGIATGPVVVGDVVGAGSSQQYVALGDMLNLAARLQARAKANTVVVVAQTTRDLAGGYFDFVVDSTRRLKGFSEPVVACVPCGQAIRRRASAERIAERLTPLIGREREVSRLMEFWRSARQSRGWLAVLCGEAGIGKSRIAESLGERIAGEAQTLRYQCSPFRANSALYPFIQQTERAADFRRNDSASRKVEKARSAARAGAG